MPDKEKNEHSRPKVSRRDFMKIGGVAVAAPLVISPRVLDAAGDQVEVHGPYKAKVALNVNGKVLSADLDTRVTLLDALRDNFELTGAKRVCDRGACGACTVLIDDKPVYACSILAIDAQDGKIVTIEGLYPGEELDALQRTFVENDAQQCGFCTPGFIVAANSYLKSNPAPTVEGFKHALGGNLCRCGTYRGMQDVVAAMANGKSGHNG